MPNTTNKGITEAEFYGGKTAEGIAGDLSAVRGILKTNGIAEHQHGVPHTGTGDFRRKLQPKTKNKCLYGRDFDTADCGAYPSGGTPYCYGHLRKLGEV